MILILALIFCLIVMALTLWRKRFVLSRRRKTTLWLGIIFDLGLIAGAITAWVLI